MLKRLKVYFLSFSIAVSPIFIIQNANASTLAGGSGWRVASTVANGIGVTVNGAKDVLINGAKKTVTGVANVTPTAGQVGKFMGKNLGTAAVIGAMDLLLDGVDYVLDPANNSVRYKPKIPPVCDDTNCKFTEYYYILGSKKYSSGQAACNSIQLGAGFGNPLPEVRYEGNYCKLYGGKNNYSGNIQASVNKVINPTYDQKEAEEKSKPKTVPLSTIGEQVVSQAEAEVRAGNTAKAAAVTQASARAAVAEAETDEVQARPIATELDKSASIPTSETAVGEIAPPTTNPDTGEVKPGSISLDFPVFCSWAPSMCVLADKVQEAIVDARDYLKEEPISEASTEVEFEEPKDTEPQKEYFRWGGQCPFSKDSETIKLNDETTEVDYDLTSWCDMATEVKPFVLGAGAIASLMIVSGTGMGRGED